MIFPFVIYKIKIFFWSAYYRSLRKLFFHKLGKNCLFEGPIDSFFIKNSVAVAGIQERSQQLFSGNQQKQIERLFLMQPTWVLDSQWQDSASRMKSEILLNQGACVFLWPRDLGKQFKDINDLCVKFKIDQLGSEFIQKNTYCGLQGIVKLKQIR